jgi:demethylmenaquinone methyltransferase/2-methoxy-6-polyprenyl-1,4-benzoquinol methylase
MTEMKFTKEAIINFFDPLAEGWDDHKQPDLAKLNTILDNAAVVEGKTVLDVACGTGVLAPLLVERKVVSVVGVDIAPEMIRIAKEKHRYPNFTFLAGDVEELDFEQQFDCILIFNSFPHFADSEKLISRMAELLAPGGYLTVAHAMGREHMNHHHAGLASAVSIDLMPGSDLARIFESYLKTVTVIDEEDIYQVVGVKE